MSTGLIMSKRWRRLLKTYTKIPIQNIYYMLCYAWDCYPEKQLVDVLSLEQKDLTEMLSELFEKAVSSLVKKGLYKEYIPHQEKLGVIRGKINFTESVRSRTFHQAKLVCDFDEFSEDILHNQLVYATLRLLIKVGNLSANIKARLKRLAPYFTNVSLIPLTATQFKLPRIHQNNHQYRFILNLCELLYRQVLIEEGSGNYQFKDFDITDQKMASLFEAFVRNFYKKECPNYKVYREVIYWEADHQDFLPRMETDICIKAGVRKIIIDTKFYKEVLAVYYDKEKIKTPNLYQLYAYLNNDPERHHYQMEGILLYPEVDKVLDLEYNVQDKKIKVKTINLNQSWQEIEERLKAIISYDGCG